MKILDSFGTNVSMKMRWNSKETVFDILCTSGYDSQEGFRSPIEFTLHQKRRYLVPYRVHCINIIICGA